MRTQHTKARVIACDGKLRAMGNLPLFAGCSSRELIDMGRLFDSAQVAAGVTIERPDASARWLFVLLEGVAALSSGGRATRVLEPGNAWGRLTSRDNLSQPQPPTSLTALSALTILSLDRRSFAALVRVRPPIARELSHLAEAEVQHGDVVAWPIPMSPVLVVVA